METIFGVLVGLVLGFIIQCISMTKTYYNGIFEVNESNPEKDIYNICINDFDRLHNKKLLLLRISRK